MIHIDAGALPTLSALANLVSSIAWAAIALLALRWVWKKTR